MINYRASKSQFLDHALREDIEDIVLRHFHGAKGSPAIAMYLDIPT